MESPRKQQGLAQAATLIMVMITISRLTGFIREMVTAQTFGRGSATDAFFAAFRVPDMMYFLLIGGALSSAFIPVFTGYLSQDKEEEGWAAASTFINVTLALLVTVTVLGIVLAPAIAPLTAYNFHGEQRLLLIRLIRLMFPAVFFTAVAGLQMGILNSYRDFFSPAMGPIVYNLGIISGTVLLGHRYGVYGMAIGVLVGAFGNVLMQFPFVVSRNRGYKLRIDLSNPGYRKMVRLMIPALLGLSVTQVNLLVNQNFASALPEGSLTALRYGDRVMQLPLGIFAMGIAQAIFPTMSRHAARGELVALRRTVELGIRALFFVTIPAAVGLMVLRVPIIQVLFEKGEFTAADTHATAIALLYYSSGLVAASAIQVLTRVYYSMQDTSTPVKTGIVMVLLNFALNLSFLNFTNLGLGGLALAFSIDGTVNMALLLYFLRKKVRGLDWRAIAGTFIKGALAAAVMGVTVYAVSQLAMPAVRSGLVRLLIATVTGVVVYITAASALKMDELRVCLNLLRRRRQAS